MLALETNYISSQQLKKIKLAEGKIIFWKNNINGMSKEQSDRDCQ